MKDAKVMYGQMNRNEFDIFMKNYGYVPSPTLSKAIPVKSTPLAPTEHRAIQTLREAGGYGYMPYEQYETIVYLESFNEEVINIINGELGKLSLRIKKKV